MAHRIAIPGEVPYSGKQLGGAGRTLFKYKYVALAGLIGLASLSAFAAWAAVAPRPSGPTSILAATTKPVVPTHAPTPTPTPLVMVTHPRTGPADFQAGVSVIVYGNDPAFPAKAQALLDHLAALNANSVGFVFPIFQDSWVSSEITTGTWTPSNDRIATFIREAHRRGFTVLLRPLLDEGSLHASGKWRGQLAPADRAAWFRSYTALLVGYGQLAQTENADGIDIGSEFNSLVGDTGQWLKLIAAVRAVYSGQLTYSSNWDVAYPQFGRALDFVSLDAFYPLAAPTTASAEQIAAAWRQWLGRAAKVGRSFGKPLVFTELGTTSEVGSFRAPYVWRHASGLSLDAQRVYYAGSCQAVKGSVVGLYWWAYDLDPLATPTTDIGYSPQGKTAEPEIGRCFG